MAITRKAGCLLGCAAVVTLALTLGCVRRTLRITSDPPNALVFLNDQEVGRTEVATDFLWYGDYDVVLRLEGYKTLQTHWNVKAPWYQVPPIDFFTEVLWPGHLHDVQTAHFTLEPQVLPTVEQVMERAVETRNAALNPEE